jgi:hypothetical protein
MAKYKSDSKQPKKSPGLDPLNPNSPRLLHTPNLLLTDLNHLIITFENILITRIHQVPVNVYFVDGFGFLLGGWGLLGELALVGGLLQGLRFSLARRWGLVGVEDFYFRQGALLAGKGRAF